MTWLPPAGTYLPLRYSFSPFGCEPDETEKFERELSQAFEGVGAFAFSSGRAALSTLLKVAAAGRQGRGIIIPAYTCFTVPSAVARAGLTVYPADIKPETLDFDYRDRSSPPPDDVIAVISPGLFGIPSYLGILEQICAEQKLFLIEDAAQTFGAVVDERPAGTFGDVSLFSFGRGKPLGGVGGGVLVAHQKALADLLSSHREEPMPPAAFKTGLKSILLSLSIRRGIFGFVRLLPFLHLGASVYQPNFPIQGMTAGVAHLIRTLMNHADTLLAARRASAAEYDSRLKDCPGIIFPRGVEGINSSYLRYPIVFEDSADRDAVLYRFSNKGLGVSTMYPIPVHQIIKAAPIVRTDLGPYPGAEKIARGILTLPTHSAVKQKEMDVMAKIIREIVTAGGDAA